MELHLQAVLRENAIHVIAGQRRLEAAIAAYGELMLEVPESGAFRLYKDTDGIIWAEQDCQVFIVHA